MLYSTKSKLIASFLGVSFLVGAVSLFVGGQLLYRSVLDEATNRVRLDLNAAREIYQTRVKLVEVSLHVSTLGFGFLSALEEEKTEELVQRLSRMCYHAGLDFAGIVTSEGNLLCRIGPNPVPQSKRQSTNPTANLVLQRGRLVSGTVLLNRAFLLDENPKLADRARIPLRPTPGTTPNAEKVETSGMAVAAAVPVFDDGRFLGVVYGGTMLSRDQSIVDTVRDTVFQNENYEGRSVGRATIFLKDIRVATNVLSQDGGRAIGTRVSEEVRRHVLEENERWTQRARVINDWYITAYEPIHDIFGNTIGILGVGVLEKKYLDMRWNALCVFILITLAGMALAVLLGCFVAGKIMKPVRRLIRGSREVIAGSLTPDIGPISDGEVGVLQNTFLEMVAAMGRRRAESQNRLLQSEKQASVGRLAAGVAHEINNPLTGVLTYTHMLLRRIDLNDEIRSDLETIVEATERVRRIVKGLLDFSRQTKLDRELMDINRLVGATISLMENQALVRGVSVNFKPGHKVPMLTLDRSQLQGVLLNIVLNGLDATQPGDRITVSTRNSITRAETEQRGVEIEIADTGCGIAPEHIDKLFDPFFTTKEVGQGTGLGLAVSLGIVQRHGGTIRVKSEVDEGSAFTVWLPVESEGV